MSKVENLDQILERFGPHLHDAPIDGWLADRTIDKVVPTLFPEPAGEDARRLAGESRL